MPKQSKNTLLKILSLALGIQVMCSTPLFSWAHTEGPDNPLEADMGDGYPPSIIEGLPVDA